MFVFILSKDILDSQYCKAEITAAIESQKMVLVVRDYMFQLPVNLPEDWEPFEEYITDKAKTIKYLP